MPTGCYCKGSSRRAETTLKRVRSRAPNRHPSCLPCAESLSGTWQQGSPPSTCGARETARKRLRSCKLWTACTSRRKRRQRLDIAKKQRAQMVSLVTLEPPSKNFFRKASCMTRSCAIAARGGCSGPCDEMLRNAFSLVAKVFIKAGQLLLCACLNASRGKV